MSSIAINDPRVRLRADPGSSDVFNAASFTSRTGVYSVSFCLDGRQVGLAYDSGRRAWTLRDHGTEVGPDAVRADWKRYAPKIEELVRLVPDWGPASAPVEEWRTVRNFLLQRIDEQNSGVAPNRTGSGYWGTHDKIASGK